MSLDREQLVAFVPTTQPEAAQDFYGRVLGLRLTEESSFASVFDAGGTTLRVTLVDSVVAPSYTVLGWRVDDIEDTVRRLGSRGVEFQSFDDLDQDQLGVWRSPGGARVAWFKDPEGNTLSVTQG